MAVKAFDLLHGMTTFNGAKLQGQLSLSTRQLLAEAMLDAPLPGATNARHYHGRPGAEATIGTGTVNILIVEQ